MQFFWSGRIFQRNADSGGSKMSTQYKQRNKPNLKAWLTKWCLDLFQLRNYSSDSYVQYGFKLHFMAPLV